MIRMAMDQIGPALDVVRLKMSNSIARRCQNDLTMMAPRLVAVSKLKPKEDVIAAYKCGQRHFGENYVQEMYDKATDATVLEECPEIKWHFIGHLQSNKVSKVTKTPNLFAIETVDSEKLATAINKSWDSTNYKLNIFLQVNTSKEENKSGLDESQVPSLAQYVIQQCPNLHLSGLMTIGAYDRDPSTDNPDFLALVECKKRLCDELKLDWNRIELSMGMSSDFEQAIQLGSTNIRVGSTIFGSRPNIKT